MCAFIASAGPGDERGHKHLILFYFLTESSWAGGQKHVESSSGEKKKRVLTGWEHVRTWLSLSFQIQFFRVCASQWACLSFSTQTFYLRICWFTALVVINVYLLVGKTRPLIQKDCQRGPEKDENTTFILLYENWVQINLFFHRKIAFPFRYVFGSKI